MTYIKTYIKYVLLGIFLASVLFTQYQLFTMKRADKEIAEMMAVHERNIFFLVQTLYTTGAVVPTEDGKDYRINPILIPPQ